MRGAWSMDPDQIVFLIISLTIAGEKIWRTHYSPYGLKALGKKAVILGSHHEFTGTRAG